MKNHLPVRNRSLLSTKSARVAAAATSTWGGRIIFLRLNVIKKKPRKRERNNSFDKNRIKITPLSFAVPQKKNEKLARDKRMERHTTNKPSEYGTRISCEFFSEARICCCEIPRYRTTKQPQIWQWRQFSASCALLILQEVKSDGDEPSKCREQRAFAWIINRYAAIFYM